MNRVNEVSFLSQIIVRVLDYCIPSISPVVYLAAFSLLRAVSFSIYLKFLGLAKEYISAESATTLSDAHSAWYRVDIHTC